MFRPVRWRSHDKNKIKVVFKFQFHATQVTQVNVESLVVSVVPGEVGKPTGRSEKGTIRDGNCKWEYPVYETVKFNQDSKTGKISERIYHFILSTGSAKSSVVGEASIDLAAYAETAKASNVSLPLKNSKSNGVLHVSIQKLQASVDQREEEDDEATNIKPRNTTLNTLFSNDENGRGIRNFTNGDVLSATNNDAEPNGVVSTVTSGSDVTVTSSGSSSGLNTPQDSQLTSNGTLQDHASTLASKTLALAPDRVTTNTNGGHHQQQPQYEWSVDSDQGLSLDGSTNSSNQQSSDVEVEKLKAELVSMARQLDLSDLELQTLRKQIVKESKRGHDLSRELKGLKEERDAIHAECEQLRGLQKGMEKAKGENKLKSEGGGGDPWLLIGEIRQELYYEKDRNANLQLQLQKTQESNAELLLALQELDEMLAQKGTTTETVPDVPSNDASKSGSDDDEEQKALEEVVKQQSDTRETYMLEQRIMDLSSEIEIYRREKDELEMQMEQLALDYEILKQEHHEISYRLEQSQLQEQLNMQYECSSPPPPTANLETEIERLEDELKEQGVEYSISLDTIKELQNHIKIVEGELDSERERMSAIVEELEGRIESLENELSKQRKAYSDSVATIHELQNNIKSLEGEIKLQEQSALQHEAAADAKIKELKSEIERLENEIDEKGNEKIGSLAIISELQNVIKTLEEEIKMQEESTLEHQASAAANREELKSEIERLEKEIEEKGNEKIGYLATFSELQRHIKSLEEEIKTQEERILQHDEAAAANTKELEAEIERLENELKEERNGYSCSLSTIKELQNHITSLEEELKVQEQNTKRLQNEFKKQQKQNSTSLATIKELETVISSMEDELERQASAFESDLGTITRERVDQEQRAIRAEEALKLIRWKNCNTAEKLQEEFKRLSKQMASTFEANENVAMKAMAEANEVRIQKGQLEDMLRRAKSELQSVKDDYEEKLVQFTNQLNLKSKQLEEKLDGTSNQKVQKLQAEIEKLAKENNLFSIQVEEMKASIKNHEELVQNGNTQRNELVNSIAILKKEAEETRSINDEKETALGLLKAQVERLQCQCDDLKHSLIEDETEKEKLRMQLVCLKGDLKKKDDALLSAEKKVKENNRRALIAPRTIKSSAAALVSNGTKEVSNLKEKIKLLEMQIRSKETALETSASSFMHKERDLIDKIDELEERVHELNQKLTESSIGTNTDNVESTSQVKSSTNEELVRELISLKERNEEMGSELLEMQERYSEISLKFAEVEGERQKLVMTVRSLKNARKELKP
ncbi:hypothetical protein LINGRAHAP2_LOCUS3233 [Linum grandiflorum]